MASAASGSSVANERFLFGQSGSISFLLLLLLLLLHEMCVWERDAAPNKLATGQLFDLLNCKPPGAAAAASPGPSLAASVEGFSSNYRCSSLVICPKTY